MQIATHLTPVDLLHLARTSKRLRSIFMNKAQRHLWVAARKNMDGLPDPPSELSEPRYAAVLFSPVCFVRIEIFSLTGGKPSIAAY